MGARCGSSWGVNGGSQVLDREWVGKEGYGATRRNERGEEGKRFVPAARSEIYSQPNDSILVEPSKGIDLRAEYLHYASSK